MSPCSTKTADRCQSSKSTFADHRSVSWLCHQCSKTRPCSSECEPKPSRESPSRCVTSTKRQETPSSMPSRIESSCWVQLSKEIFDWIETYGFHICHHIWTIPIATNLKLNHKKAIWIRLGWSALCIKISYINHSLTFSTWTASWCSLPPTHLSDTSSHRE